MENLCFLNSVSLFVIMVVIVLLPHLSSAYSRPEKFYINCGSDSNVSYGQTFVGDKNASGNGNSVSFTENGTEVFENKASTAPDIYRTVRIFRQPSSYKFQLDSVGLHFVRLHFSAVSSMKELLAASFNVSATSGLNHLLKSFSLQKITVTPRVEEFLLMMDSTKFEIQFVPDRSSLALVNAIEVFSADNDLKKLPESDRNLHTIYRLNVGGELIAPDYDTLGRTWLPDDDFLFRKESAKNISSSQKPNYDLVVTKYTAPHFVYQTAKKMVELYPIAKTKVNVTWTFKVKSNYRHFLRFHFCDILNNSETSDFNLYINGNWREDVKPSGYGSMTPFFIDVVNASDGSGFFNVSMGTKETNTFDAFLNGLEVMEVLGKSGSDSSENSSSHRFHIIAGCVTAAASALALVLSLLFMVFLRRRRSKKTNPEVEVTVSSPLPLYNGGGSTNKRPLYSENNSPLGNLQLGLKIPFTDITRATNNFDDQWLIGKGGFGNVYKAILPDGTKVAIKRGKVESGQGILEFHTEIQVLSRISHRHLVSLTCYCEENSEMILVYELMENGTLREHLYGSNLPSLSWEQRLEICIGAARGLHYLHNGLDEAIVHRDVKSTNILLDENNVAKVADFGISKIAVRTQDPINISTNIKGTFGYLDPDYVLTRMLTEKSDVYAFGVVLLEVLCARPALNNRLPDEEVNLAVWAMSCKSQGIIDKIVDPKLIGQIEPISLIKFMEIAEKYLKDRGDERPNMAAVIWNLEYVLRLQTIHEGSALTISSYGSLVMVSDCSERSLETRVFDRSLQRNLSMLIFTALEQEEDTSSFRQISLPFVFGFFDLYKKQIGTFVPTKQETNCIEGNMEKRSGVWF